MSRLSVLHVVSELYPFVKTGGLADVAAALPPALRAANVDARVVIPGFAAIRAALRDARVVREDANLFGGGPSRVLAGTLDGTEFPAFVIDCPGLYERPGGPYQDPQGVDFPDNALRFAALAFIGAELASSQDPALRADVLHTHDWQAGLGAAYVKLRGARTPRCVATIHAISYPGTFDRSVLREIAIPESAFTMDGIEFFGRVSYLKAALQYADRITTVSPTYALEIQEDGHGGGFEGLLRSRSRDVSGILNGVDYELWDPSSGLFIPRRYGAKDLRGKAYSKAALERRLGFPPDPRAPILGLVSRLVWQKGIDWVVELVPWIVERGARLAVLGTGDPAIADALRAYARRFPKQVALTLGYDEELSHLVQAGSDAILVPSRTEPCGLTQLYALRYGSPPVVRRTGGLADSVVDVTKEGLDAKRSTGFVFEEESAAGLRSALTRFLEVYQQPVEFRRLQRAGMARDFSWEGPAERYVDLYRRLISS